MGKNSQSAGSANGTDKLVSCPDTASANPSSSSTRHNLCGAGTLVFTPAVPLLLGKALEANEGLVPTNGSGSSGCSSPSLDLDQGILHSDKAHLEANEIHGDHPGIPDGETIGPGVDRLSPNIAPFRFGLAKGNASAVVKPSVNRQPTVEETETRRTRAADHHGRHYATGQAPRGPTKKALLITADSSPRIDDQDDVAELDYTASDSERFERCIKKLGFGCKDIHVIKATGNEFLTEKSVIEGLEFLLSGAVDGDVLVLFVSTHAARFQLGGGVCLKLLKPDGSVMLMGTRIVFDTCYAAGLIECKHVIRQMVPKCSTTATSTLIETDAMPSVPYLCYLLASQRRQNEAHPPTHFIDPDTRSSAIPTPSTSVRNHNFAVQPSSLGLQVQSDVFIWAAANKGEKAYECIFPESEDGLEGKNGGLVGAICMAIEKNGYLPRIDVFDKYISTTMEEMNNSVDPQHAQLLSNREDKNRILSGNIFEHIGIVDLAKDTKDM
ncbi:hypothetical protein FRC07_006392 [Ceratobasidium sp. 392]|nr:hypothetical protein FRC07_006392 [Ceratobasidium sp. 392]